MTLINELDLDRVNVNHQAKYLKGHFVHKLASGQTHISDQLLYQNHKVVMSSLGLVGWRAMTFSTHTSYIVLTKRRLIALHIINKTVCNS